MLKKKRFALILIFLLSLQAFPQLNPENSSSTPSLKEPPADEPRRPNSKRIRRHLNLIVGVEHDEEFLIPDKEITVAGRTDYFDINRIKGTDYFRITPKKSGNGITTLKDKKTGQILVEIRFTIRDDSVEKNLRELQTMLGDIEGIEFKLVGEFIYIDGLILVPQDLNRISQVIQAYPNVKSLVRLNPLSWKKIAEFISNEVNNPEVKISAVGSYLKLEGQVNSQAEKDRIKQIVFLYMPDLVADKPGASEAVSITPRKSPGAFEDKIIDLITIKKDDEKVEPPPKMIQIVAHFVKYGDTYKKSFTFSFSPAVSTSSASQGSSSSTFDSTIALLSNLLPKLNWDKMHGHAKILDTASILVQDKVKGSIQRQITTRGPDQIIATASGTQTNPTFVNARVSLEVTPTIKSERSGLIELKDLKVAVSSSGEPSDQTDVLTTISVRDRQSAAFGGVIKKGNSTSYGAPANPDAIITLNASKLYGRDNAQFVVFVTPIIKSSASTGVEQVKKKFRLRD